jgi:sugar phosphate isomerase/epimerase
LKERLHDQPDFWGSFLLLPQFSNAEFAVAARELGVDNVSISNVHGKFQEPQNFDEIIGIYRDANLEISNIGVVGLDGEEAADRNAFEFMRRAGTKIMAVNFQPGTFDRASKLAQELAEEYDVWCGIHNHGGYHWLGNSEILEHIFKNSGPRLGLFLDTAWALSARQNPVEMVKKFGDRLYGIHLKDFIFDRNGKPKMSLSAKAASTCRRLCAPWKKSGSKAPARSNTKPNRRIPCPRCKSALPPSVVSACNRDSKNLPNHSRRIRVLVSGANSCLSN